MARTANRQQVRRDGDITATSLLKVSRVGIYARLSHDSRDKQSGSIENQQMILQEYIEAQDDLEFADSFYDDGVSGTTFERDGFQKLLLAVRANEIDCVMVKDLSRFARNNSEASDYLEKIFPFMGVRFISVMDHYDSSAMSNGNEQLVINLKNLIHEHYAMDISRKIHASVEMKQNRGETTGGNTVPYGYFVKSGEKYFSIDESSIIVEQIFAMALQGLSSGAIAKKLTADGVLRPSQYRKTGSLSIFDGFSESNAWYASTIDRILANGAYTGDTYCRKSQKKLYERTERVYFGKEDWKCVENTHPAIISKEDFEKVQELRAKARKRYREKCKVKAVGTVHLESNIFEGKIFCGDCGSPMYWMEDPRYRNHERFWGKTYKCGSFVTNHTMCSSKRIIEEDVCDVVQKAIVSRVVLVDACLKFIKTETANSFSEILKQYESRKLKQTGKLNFLESQKASIYMEYADGGCSVSDYEKKKAGLLLEIETQKRKIMETSNRIKKINKAIKQENRLHKAWISGKKSSVIDRSMVDAFVEQIRVYDDKRIEIDFTFEDEIQSLVSAREEMDLWQAA